MCYCINTVVCSGMFFQDGLQVRTTLSYQATSTSALTTSVNFGVATISQSTMEYLNIYDGWDTYNVDFYGDIISIHTVSGPNNHYTCAYFSGWIIYLQFANTIASVVDLDGSGYTPSFDNVNNLIKINFQCVQNPAPGSTYRFQVTGSTYRFQV